LVQAFVLLSYDPIDNDFKLFKEVSGPECFLLRLLVDGAVAIFGLLLFVHFAAEDAHTALVSLSVAYSDLERKVIVSDV